MNPTPCLACGASIVFSQVKSGKWMPYEAIYYPGLGDFGAGEPHWAKCPEAEKLRGARRVKTRNGKVGLQTRMPL